MSGSVGFVVEGKHTLVYCHDEAEPEFLGNEMLEFISKINDNNDWSKIKKLVYNFKEVQSSRYHGMDQLKNMYMYNDNNLCIDNSFICTLYCDFGYIINLDSMLLEYYVGAQDKPQKGNRFGVQSLDSMVFPCKLSQLYQINNININIIDDIIDDMNSIDDKNYSVITIHRKLKLKNLNTVV